MIVSSSVRDHLRRPIAAGIESSIPKLRPLDDFRCAEGLTIVRAWKGRIIESLVGTRRSPSAAPLALRFRTAPTTVPLAASMHHGRGCESDG